MRPVTPTSFGFESPSSSKVIRLENLYRLYENRGGRFSAVVEFSEDDSLNGQILFFLLQIDEAFWSDNREPLPSSWTQPWSTTLVTFPEPGEAFNARLRIQNLLYGEQWPYSG